MARQLVRTLTWGLVVTGLAFLGRLTIIDGTALSMVWPAAGGAVLWFLGSRMRWWAVDAVVLAVVTGVVNHVTGAPWRLVPVFLAANVVQVLLAAGLLRRTAPGLRTGALRSTTELWSLAVAAFAGSLAGAAVGSAGMMMLLDHWRAEDFLAWWGRNCAGIVAVVALVLLWRRAGESRTGLRGRVPEATTLLATTAVMYWAAFVHFGNLPIAFPLMIVTVWAGLRFDALLVHLHSLTVSTAVVALSLNGYGPFAGIGTVHVEAMVSQLFIALIIIFGLALALGRDERLALLQRLAHAESTASDQARRLSTLVDQMHDGLTLLDEDGTVLLRNPAGRAILGKLAERTHAAQGLGTYELLTVELQPVAEEDLPYRRALVSGAPVVQDLVLRRSETAPPDPHHAGDQVLECVATPFEGSDGTRQVLVVFRDVTDERSHLRSVESFASVVAHDLNTPLTVVDGWTDVLLTELRTGNLTDPAEIATMLTRVQDGSRRMRSLIRDLLAFSSAQKAELDPEPVEMTAIAHTAAQLRREAHDGPPPRITVGDLPTAMAEPALIRQVLDNLIGNAVKYTWPGETAEVEVAGRLLEDWVEITVTDRGIGIPFDKQPTVFDAFVRVHPAAYTGHGLGLSICKRIVERYGGHIRVQDNPAGRGSRFVFTLPAARGRNTYPPATGITTVRG